MTLQEVQKLTTKDELRELCGTLLGAMYHGEKALEKAASFCDETPDMAHTRKLLHDLRELGWKQIGELQQDIEAGR